VLVGAYFMHQIEAYFNSIGEISGLT